METPDLDKVTQVRDMYRQDNSLTTAQIAGRMGVSMQQAKALYTAAHKAEMAAGEAFADEAQRMEEAQKPVPGRDPDFYIRDRETGMLFKLQVHTDKPKRIVFETEDITVQTGRGL